MSEALPLPLVVMSPRYIRARAWWRPSLLLGTVAALGGPALAGPPAPPELRVARHLIDDLPPPRSSPFVRRGYTTLASVRKLTPAASAPLAVGHRCPGDDAPGPRATRPCAITLPTVSGGPDAFIVETGALPLLRFNAKRRPPGLPRRAPTGDFTRRRRFVLHRHARRGESSIRAVPRWMTSQVQAWPSATAGARAFASRRFTVAAGSVLTFAVGVEEPAWHVDSAPVQFLIAARTARGVRELYRRTLDPTRRTDDRRWIDERVSLTPLAGETVSLLFMVRPVRPADRRPQLPIWGDPTILAPADPTLPSQPSIVLVSLDTLRARSMSVYGREIETTPWFSRFAETSVRFTNAVTTYSNTFGAHVSMLTGAYPARHGIRRTPVLSHDIPTLAERLRTAGYDTAAFTEDALLDADAGFQRGFGHYWENTTVGAGAGDAPGTFGRALEWVRTHRDRPFFLFVHTYAVHAPYLPRPPYDGMFIGAEAPPPSDQQLAYEQEVRALDDDTAALVAGLDALLGSDRFILVVTADHGEEFGEHGGFTHLQLYEEVLHVPLFMRWPGRLPAGRTVPELVSLVDVAPTVLDLAGVEATVESGRSLQPLFDGSDGPWERTETFAEAPPSAFIWPQWTVAARRTDAVCFSYGSPERDRCFDLTTDPRQQRPLPPDGRFTDLFTAARTYRDALLANPAAPPQAPAPPGAPAPAANDPVRAEKLRALGYLE